MLIKADDGTKQEVAGCVVRLGIEFETVVSREL